MSKHDKDVHGARRLKLPYPIQTPSEPSALRISLQVAVMKLRNMLPIDVSDHRPKDKPHLNTIESMIASSLVVSMLVYAEKRPNTPIGIPQMMHLPRR